MQYTRIAGSSASASSSVEGMKDGETKTTLSLSELHHFIQGLTEAIRESDAFRVRTLSFLLHYRTFM